MEIGREGEQWQKVLQWDNEMEEREVMKRGKRRGLGVTRANSGMGNKLLFVDVYFRFNPL